MFRQQLKNTEECRVDQLERTVEGGGAVMSLGSYMCMYVISKKLSYHRVMINIISCHSVS